MRASDAQQRELVVERAFLLDPPPNSHHVQPIEKANGRYCYCCGLNPIRNFDPLIKECAKDMSRYIDDRN